MRGGEVRRGVDRACQVDRVVYQIRLIRLG